MEDLLADVPTSGAGASTQKAGHVTDLLSDVPTPATDLLHDVPTPGMGRWAQAIEHSPAGALGRFAGRLPGAVVGAAKNALMDTPYNIGSAAIDLATGAPVKQPLPAGQAPVVQPPVPGGFNFQFAPTGVPTEGAPAQAPDATLDQSDANYAKYLQEAKDTMGASLVRDAALTGLTASGLGTPLGVAATVGVPAVMEATGANEAVKGVAGLVRGEKPGIVRDLAGGITEQLPTLLALISHWAPKLAPPATQALPDAVLGQHEAAPPTAKPLAAKLDELVSPVTKKLGMEKPLSDYTVLSPVKAAVDKVMEQSPVVDKYYNKAKDFFKAPLEKVPEDVANLERDRQGISNLAKTTADAMGKEIAENYSPSEQAIIGQLTRSVPPMRLQPNQVPKFEGDLATNTPEINRRLGLYKEDAMSKLMWAPEKVRDVVARGVALQRVFEDMGGKDVKQWFNYKRTAAELAPVNKEVAGLREKILQPGEKTALEAEAKGLKAKQFEAQRPGFKERYDRFISNRAEAAKLLPNPEGKPEVPAGNAPTEGGLVHDPNVSTDLAGAGIRKIMQTLKDLPKDEIQMPTAEQAKAFKKLRTGRMPEEVKPAGQVFREPIPEVGSGATEPVRLLYTQPGEKFPNRGTRPAVMPEAVRKQTIEDAVPAKPPVEPKRVLDALVAPNGRDLKAEVANRVLEGKLKADAPLSREELLAIQGRRAEIAKTLKTNDNSLERYKTLTELLQQNYKHGDEGYLKRINALHAQKAAEQLVNDLELGNLKGENRSRTKIDEKGFTHRKVESDLAFKTGFKSAAPSLSRSILDNGLLAANKHFFDGLAKTPHAQEIVSPEQQALLEGQGWRKLEGEQNGAMDGKLVSPEVWNLIKDVQDPELQSSATKHIIGWIMGNHAAGNAARVVQNLLGGLLQQDLIAGRSLPVAIKNMISGHGELNGEYATDIKRLGMQTMSGSAAKKLEAMIPEMSAVHDAHVRADAAKMTWAHHLTGAIDTMMAGVSKGLQPLVGELGKTMDPAAVKEVFSSLEQSERVGLYVDLRRQGLNHNEAAQKMKDTFVDYSQSSDFVKKFKGYGAAGLGSRLIQFGADMAKQAVHVAFNANPLVAARFWKYYLANKLWNDHMQKINGETDAERKQRLSLRQPNEMGPNSFWNFDLPKNAKGQVMAASFSNANPFGAVSDALSEMTALADGAPGSKGSTAGRFFEMAPPAREALAQWNNRDDFYDKPIAPEQMDLTDPEALVARLEHMLSTLGPEQYGRYPANIARKDRQDNNPYAQNMRGNRVTAEEALVNELTGIKLNHFDAPMKLHDLATKIAALNFEKQKAMKQDLTTEQAKAYMQEIGEKQKALAKRAHPQ